MNGQPRIVARAKASHDGPHYWGSSRTPLPVSTPPAPTTPPRSDSAGDQLPLPPQHSWSLPSHSCHRNLAWPQATIVTATFTSTPGPASPPPSLTTRAHSKLQFRTPGHLALTYHDVDHRHSCPTTHFDFLTTPRSRSFSPRFCAFCYLADSFFCRLASSPTLPFSVLASLLFAD